MTCVQPTVYSIDELRLQSDEQRGLYKATQEYRKIELDDYYDAVYADAYERTMRLFGATDDLESIDPARDVGDDVSNIELLRYMCRPSLSKDDFRNATGVNSDSVRSVRSGNNAEKVVACFQANMNAMLIPWKGRRPEEGEKRCTATAVAAMIADQLTKMEKRTKVAASQETSVRDFLKQNGFSEIPNRTIASSRDFPAPMEVFEGSVSVGGTKGDVVFALPDGRLMAIECKVSSTFVNSHKRLNHEAVDKAHKWLAAFGTTNIVPACMLEGLFTADNLSAAQDEGLYIFWSSDLSALKRYLDRVKSAL